MKPIYCDFAANQDLEVASTEQYGDRQLMVRSTAPLGASTSSAGLEYICFPLPPEEQVPAKYADVFNEEFCFELKNGKRYIQLGPAALLNVCLLKDDN